MQIEIRTCDDWVAVYKDGVKVEENHSVSLKRGLEALGIPFVQHDYTDQMEDGLGILKDGTDPFPEEL